MSKGVSIFYELINGYFRFSCNFWRNWHIPINQGKKPFSCCLQCISCRCFWLVRHYDGIKSRLSTNPLIATKNVLLLKQYVFYMKKSCSRISPGQLSLFIVRIDQQVPCFCIIETQQVTINNLIRVFQLLCCTVNKRLTCFRISCFSRFTVVTYFTCIHILICYKATITENNEILMFFRKQVCS